MVIYNTNLAFYICDQLQSIAAYTKRPSLLWCPSATNSRCPPRRPRSRKKDAKSALSVAKSSDDGSRSRAQSAFCVLSRADLDRARRVHAVARGERHVRTRPRLESGVRGVHRAGTVEALPLFLCALSILINGHSAFILYYNTAILVGIERRGRSIHNCRCGVSCSRYSL